MQGISKEHKREYFDGTKNRIIRYWFYSQKGLDIFNNMKYLFMLIFGVYYTLKLVNPIWLILMFMVSVPTLIWVGYIAVNHIGKVVEFLNIQYSTHWGRYGFELQEKQNKLLEEIKEKL